MSRYESSHIPGVHSTILSPLSDSNAHPLYKRINIEEWFFVKKKEEKILKKRQKESRHSFGVPAPSFFSGLLFSSHQEMEKKRGPQHAMLNWNKGVTAIIADYRQRFHPKKEQQFARTRKGTNGLLGTLEYALTENAFRRLIKNFKKTSPAPWEISASFDMKASPTIKLKKKNQEKNGNSVVTSSLKKCRQARAYSANERMCKQKPR